MVCYGLHKMTDWVCPRTGQILTRHAWKSFKEVVEPYGWVWSFIYALIYVANYSGRWYFWLNKSMQPNLILGHLCLTLQIVTVSSQLDLWVNLLVRQIKSKSCHISFQVMVKSGCCSAKSSQTATYDLIGHFLPPPDWNMCWQVSLDAWIIYLAEYMTSYLNVC